MPEDCADKILGLDLLSSDLPADTLARAHAFMALHLRSHNKPLSLTEAVERMTEVLKTTSSWQPPFDEGEEFGRPATGDGK